MKTNKGFASVGIIITIIAILAVGSVAYYAGKSSKKIENKEETKNATAQDEQVTSLITPKQLSSCFISPQTGETWPFGSTNTIQLKNAPVYNSHCSNTFSLINTTTNQRAGYLGIQSNQGQSSYPWTSTDTILSFSCGTSGDEFPAYVSPGQYKIRFEEQDTVSGMGPIISCESDNSI